MKLLIKRIPKLDYTIGHLYIDGKYFCDTLEDPVRDLNKNGVFDNGEVKIYGNTAIPYGTYKVTITYSNKYKRDMPLINDVPSFTGIRIHSGNTTEDTKGCILVGENKVVGKVINSKLTFDKLYPILETTIKEGEQITIEII
jgi:hypothetical protein